MLQNNRALFVGVIVFTIVITLILLDTIDKTVKLIRQESETQQQESQETFDRLRERRIENENSLN